MFVIKHLNGKNIAFYTINNSGISIFYSLTPPKCCKFQTLKQARSIYYKIKNKLFDTARIYYENSNSDTNTR